MTILLTRHAVDDLRDACDHYSEVGRQEKFLADVDLLMKRIVTFPDGAAPVEGFPGLRRARMRQFPFGVFYRVEDDGDLVIIRILHTRQDHAAGLPE